MVSAEKFLEKPFMVLETSEKVLEFFVGKSVGTVFYAAGCF